MNQNALTDTLRKVLLYPGKPTSAVLIYVHDSASVHAHTDVSSKEDAAKLLAEVEKVANSLRSLIEKGKF